MSRLVIGAALYIGANHAWHGYWGQGIAIIVLAAVICTTTWGDAEETR